MLLVAEQLPELLPVAVNILPVYSSKTFDQDIHPDEEISQYEDEGDIDDGGSTLTIGTTETQQSDSNKIIQIENEIEEIQRERRCRTPKYEDENSNESCISPFFLVLYTFLGCLIVILIGLNFWFGFHLLFLISLFAVIAFFILVLTEFSEFHNLSIEK